MAIFNSYVKLPEGTQLVSKKNIPASPTHEFIHGNWKFWNTGWWCNNHLEKWWSSSMGRMTSIHMKWKINNVPNHQPDIGLWIDDHPLWRKKPATFWPRCKVVKSQPPNSAPHHPKDLSRKRWPPQEVLLSELYAVDSSKEGTYTFFPNSAVVNLLQKNLILDTSWYWKQKILDAGFPRKYKTHFDPLF